MSELDWRPKPNNAVFESPGDLICCDGQQEVGDVFLLPPRGASDPYRWSWRLFPVGRSTRSVDHGLEQTRLQAKRQLAAAYRRRIKLGDV